MFITTITIITKDSMTNTATELTKFTSYMHEKNSTFVPLFTDKHAPKHHT